MELCHIVIGMLIKRCHNTTQRKSELLGCSLIANCTFRIAQKSLSVYFCDLLVEIPKDVAVNGFVAVDELNYAFDGKRIAVSLGDINTAYHE